MQSFTMQLRSLTLIPLCVEDESKLPLKENLVNQNISKGLAASS